MWLNSDSKFIDMSDVFKYVDTPFLNKFKINEYSGRRMWWYTFKNYSPEYVICILTQNIAYLLESFHSNVRSRRENFKHQVLDVVFIPKFSFFELLNKKHLTKFKSFCLIFHRGKRSCEKKAAGFCVILVCGFTEMSIDTEQISLIECASL